MDAGTVSDNIRAITADFAAERRRRQQRRELVAADFARLREAGFLLTGVPVDHGGIWAGIGTSARPICEMLRTLAHGDVRVTPVDPSHGTPRMSSKNRSGAVSPSGTAIVIM